MLLSLIALFGGMALLIKGADWLVDGSSNLAKKLGISTLVIGLTIVAFGTSMPELLVNVISATKGNTDIAFGNVVGSNIVNILLVLGVAAIIHPPKIARSTVWAEIPFTFLAGIALLVMTQDRYLDGLTINVLTRTDGIALLLFFAIFLYYMSTMAFKDTENKEGATRDSPIIKTSNLTSGLLILTGIIALYVGGSATVFGATQVAKQFGLSDLLISITIVAIGTSLPELVTSVKAARRKESDLAVGNVVGSSIFNIFGILGVTAVIKPINLPIGATIDLLVMILASSLLFLLMFIGRRHRLGRNEGMLFIVLYILYLMYTVIRG